MNKPIAAIAALTLALGLTACSSDGTDEYEQRKNDNAAVKQIVGDGETLEQSNLLERLRRQSKPTAIGYVYLTTFGQPIGYYVIKGKVSNAGSQLAPEQEVLRRCSGCEQFLSDGPQDDKTYGVGDPGIFFFTAEGTMVETDFDYIYSDQPLDLDVPLLAK